MVILKIIGAMILIGIIWAAYKDLRQSYKEVKRREKVEERNRRARAFQEQQEQELQNTIRFYLSTEKKMDAIKECKDYYDCSLSKAKTIVSEIEFEMAYEKEHGEDYRPHANGRTHRIESTGQRVNALSSCPSNIDGMEGHKFEYFCADLLLKNGFDKADVTPGSGDQGVDILAVKDGVKYAIQCKNYKSPLSNTPVQEVNAGKMFYGCHVGIVMTNSTFTPGAQKLAEATGVMLWDRAYVEKLMEKAGIDDKLPAFSGTELTTANEGHNNRDIAEKQNNISSPAIQSLEHELHDGFLNKYGFDLASEKRKYNKHIRNKKAKTLLLCIFFGGLGVHRFYLGKIATGIIWLLTCGCFGIGWIVDIILVTAGKMKDSKGSVIDNAQHNELSEVDIALHEINYWMNQITDDPPTQLMTSFKQLATAAKSQTDINRELHEVCLELFSYCQQLKFLSTRYKDACYRLFQFVFAQNEDGWTTEDSFLETNQQLRNIISSSVLNIANQLESITTNHSSKRQERELQQLILAGKTAIERHFVILTLRRRAF